MSHSCYKLTLFDGLKERVIVSSIKKYYTPEQLVGKKIIVVANLKPARFTGVTSEGMLLAGTNNACGCQIVFVDDCVPRARASADCKSKTPCIRPVRGDFFVTLSPTWPAVWGILRPETKR